MRIIDVHAHYVPETLWEAEQDRGFFSVDKTGLDQRVQMLNDGGIDIQVLSPVARYSNSNLELTMRHNDAMAQEVDQYPNRFIGMASIALNEPDTASKELERSVKDLGMKGATIGSNATGVNLDAKEFGPFYSKAQELGVPIFVHPMTVLGQDRLQKYQLDNLIGNPTDTSVAVASLIFGGVLNEFPKIKIYLAHGGGTCTYLAPRWDQGSRSRLASSVKLNKLPSEYLKLLHFDSLTHSTLLLENLAKYVGADHIMLGSDYPYDMGDRESIAKVQISEVLSEREKRLISGETAENYFGIEP